MDYNMGKMHGDEATFKVLIIFKIKELVNNENY